MLMVDALATAAFGIDNTGLKPGQSVAVVGLGPIGLLVVEVPLMHGASEVFAIDPIAAHRTQEKKLSAVTFAPGKEAVAATVEATKGGVDCVFEVSGASAAFRSTLLLAKVGGALSLVGLPQPDVTLPLNHILFTGITVKAGV